MNGFLVIFLMFTSHAGSSSMDEKRLKNFDSHLLKKEAYEDQRLRSSADEKQRRIKREETYDKQRNSFRRPVHTEPPGRESFEQKEAAAEKKYERVREAYSTKKQQMVEALHQKNDRTKMIEYEL